MLTSNYLSSLPDNRLQNIRYRLQSLRTRTRKSTKNLGVFLKIHESSPPTNESQDSNPVLTSKACRFLHHHTQSLYAQYLLALPDQGKVARCLSMDLYANGSTWKFNGLNTRFKDWRFIHRARLNCIPLNAPKSRWSNTSPRCRHCDADETLMFSVTVTETWSPFVNDMML